MKHPASYCPDCGGDRDKDPHSHCGDCKARKVKGVPTKHSTGCRQLTGKLSRGQFCPKCNRLLAAGASCPEHGNPSPRQVVTSEGSV